MFLVTFFNVSDALIFEKSAKNSDSYTCDIVPVPRELTSSCGYAANVKVRMKSETYVLDIMKKIGITWEALYEKIPKDSQNFSYIPIS